MREMTTIHTQDLSDVLSAARLMVCENSNSINAQMFRASLGGLFCEEGAMFGQKIDAYESNKAKIPEILCELAVELDRRESKATA